MTGKTTHSLRNFWRDIPLEQEATSDNMHGNLVMEKTHRLKTWPGPFQAVKRGDKKFEYRVNDRDFMEGDGVILQEYDPLTQTYTGEELPEVSISYLIEGPDFGVPENFVVFSWY